LGGEGAKSPGVGRGGFEKKRGEKKRDRWLEKEKVLTGAQKRWSLYPGKRWQRRKQGKKKKKKGKWGF